jgi:hypothetical protein
MVQVIAMFGSLVVVAACQSPTSARINNPSQGTLVADTKPGDSGRTGLAREGGGMPEGIGFSQGHYYYIHTGTAIQLFQHQRFVHGYSYDTRGRVIAPTGEIVRLTDGEMVTFTGDRLPLPPGIPIP